MKAIPAAVVGVSLAFIVCFRASAACPPGFKEIFGGVCVPSQEPAFRPQDPARVGQSPVPPSSPVPSDLPQAGGAIPPPPNGYAPLGGAADSDLRNRVHPTWNGLVPTESAAPDRNKPNYGESLVPVRTFLDKDHIPPEGVGAYGILAFRGRPTAATMHRLSMACESFLAYLPRLFDVPKYVSLSDQMVTIWPIDNPDAAEVKAENCNFLLKHYNIYPAGQAMQDARRQKAKFDGDGPFLIGWSPSDARGKPDKLVLVVDMSGYESQDRFDHAFQFWKEKIVLNPELWRSGWSLDQVRLAIRDFVDKYGADILKAAHLSDSSGEKKISE
jgi:hypothetical protein